MQSLIIVPSPILPAEENMDLRKEQQAWVNEQIRVAVDALKPKGWKKAVFLLRELGPLATIVAVFMTLLAITCGAIYQSVVHVTSETEFRTHTADTLVQIQATLRELQASQSPKRVIQEIARLDTKQFSRNLTALQKAAEQPIEKAAASIGNIQEIAQKLRDTNESSPDYWPAVLQFISFASAGLAPANVPPPNTPPILKSSNLMLANNHFSGMTVELNGGLLDGDVFENCRVIFTDTPVTMKNVVFVNSVFEFPISSVPSLYIQQASKLLLASDLKSAHIPSL